MGHFFGITRHCTFLCFQRLIFFDSFKSFIPGIKGNICIVCVAIETFQIEIFNIRALIAKMIYGEKVDILSYYLSFKTEMFFAFSIFEL